MADDVATMAFDWCASRLPFRRSMLCGFVKAGHHATEFPAARARSVPAESPLVQCLCHETLLLVQSLCHEALGVNTARAHLHGHTKSTNSLSPHAHFPLACDHERRLGSPPPNTGAPPHRRHANGARHEAVHVLEPLPGKSRRCLEAGMRASASVRKPPSCGRTATSMDDHACLLGDTISSRSISGSRVWSALLAKMSSGRRAEAGMQGRRASGDEVGWANLLRRTTSHQQASSHLSRAAWPASVRRGRGRRRARPLRPGRARPRQPTRPTSAAFPR